MKSNPHKVPINFSNGLSFCNGNGAIIYNILYDAVE